MNNAIQRLLDGKVLDPRTGVPVQVPIRRIEVSFSLAGEERDLVSSLGFGPTLAVVSDPDTEGALGARVKRALSDRGRLIPILLPRSPRPDSAAVEAILREAGRADALIAVGSGTINDLCKYAAARLNRPYAVFATAPSMNGYTSGNASIFVEGLKRTLPARPPEGAFFDLQVLASSPPRLIRAGLGDTICRPTAQADWLLAYRIRGDAYHPLPFELLIEEEEQLLAEPEALAGGDLQAVGRLARALILSGLGMLYCGGSQPASQGEHLIAHYMELFASTGGPEPLHGEQIGVCTLTMARLQEALLELPRIEVHPCQISEGEFLGRYGRSLAEHCWNEFLPKRLDPQAASTLNQRLATDWEGIRLEVAKVIRPADRVLETLRRAEAPIRPGQLGWAEDEYRQAVLHAAELRNRYTFLDLARDCRLLEHLIDAPAGVE